MEWYLKTGNVIVGAMLINLYVPPITLLSGVLVAQAKIFIDRGFSCRKSYNTKK